MEAIENSQGQPKWLNQIQNKSWEAELLISGGAVVSLLQISDFLYAQFLKTSTLGFFAPMYVLMFTVPVKILVVYFSFHILLRSFWLSIIFLQKIYPDGIKIDRLNFAEPFRSISANFNISERISQLDRYSSLLFSWALTFVLIWIGLTLAFGIGSLPAFISRAYFPQSVAKPFPSFLYISIPILITLYIYLIDTFFYGALRRSKFLAKKYYPIYSFWNTISLGFLWRPILQLIFSNVKSKWKASSFALFLTLIGLFFSGDSEDFFSLLDTRKHQTSAMETEEKRYLDKIPESEWSGSAIQSDIIQDNFLKVFVPYNYFDDPKIDSLKSKKKYFSDIIKLSLDDSVYSSLNWVGIKKVNGHKGINTVINIKHMDEGLHSLKIIRISDNDSSVLIPFWKQ